MAMTVTEETYKSVCERDHWRCVICGREEGLHLHHINGRSRLKTNYVDNCVMLCWRCHRMVHEHNKDFRRILNEYIERRNNETN